MKPLPSTARRASTLDRAIAASLIAMAAMNLFVLSHQLQPAPQFAAAEAGEDRAA